MCTEKNIVKRFAQIRMLSDIRYDIIYFARASMSYLLRNLAELKI